MEASGDPMSVQSIHSALTAKLNGQTPRFEILQDDLVSMQEDGFVMLASKTTYILTP